LIDSLIHSFIDHVIVFMLGPIRDDWQACW